MKNYLTEFIGTFFLVLIVGLVLGAAHSIGYLAPVAIGSALMGMTYMGKHLSGSHYNPAITLAVYIRGGFHWKEALLYVLAQLLGAFAAAALCLILVQDDAFNFGQALSPGIDATYVEALLIEVLFTFALALVFLNCSMSEATRGNSFFGLAIGFTVLSALYAGGGISGGAFNPALGIAPNVLGGDTGDIWIYLLGPFLGGALAGFTFNFLNSPN